MTDALLVPVIGVPGSWSSEALADAVAARTGRRLLVDLADVALDTAGGAVTAGGFDLCRADAVLVKKAGVDYGPGLLDRLEILRYVEARGVPVFSSPARVIGLVDRLACTVALGSAGIPMPATVVTESAERAAEAVRAFGRAVLKPLYSTKARGMRLVSADGAELAAEIAAFQAAGNPVLYVQELLDLPGRDLGVAFVGEEYVGTYARVKGDGAWNTTIRAGGSYRAHEPSAETLAVARRARDLFGLAFTSVDVAEGPDGPLVFEVSAFGGYRGLREALDVDAAGRFADHVLQELARV